MAKVRTRRVMRSRLFFFLFAAAMLPALASGESTVQPKYPPSFDCSAVPAGSQRQACNRSHLDPPMGAIPETKRNTQPALTIPHPTPPQVPTTPPPTIPRLPGTINNTN